ncbi:TPA: hypothetical protein ACPQXF_001360 [Streptococcus mutans]|jgi:hypothetical protein|uniref:hypothetical protein n=1 Tax=Streptococcus mutans TaxID=1309 RepID=UPI0004B6B294|nr:hypothetical protein [Streptococcus mutans]MCB5016496.1 hypothetical protein [Streptococcus mutans]MCB5028116.1 hypothetical protein [Streptococcus mutans]MCB5113284.1 hypothetical protein [Streptococcus mutans]MDT9521705.1 hypothetical protein [Streptococcus mutans]
MRKKIASWILFILGGIAIFLGLSALLTLSAADKKPNRNSYDFGLVSSWRLIYPECLIYFKMSEILEKKYFDYFS